MKVSPNIRSFDITGFVLALYKSGQPVMATSDGHDFVLVCSTKEKLSICLSDLNITEEVDFKRIDDSSEFLSSLPVPVMLNPWITPEGNTRFKMVFRGSVAPILENNNESVC